MQLVKLLVTDSLLENNPDEEFDELRFAVDADGTKILGNYLNIPQIHSSNVSTRIMLITRKCRR